MKATILGGLLLAALGLTTACSDDEDKTEEPVSASGDADGEPMPDSSDAGAADDAAAPAEEDDAAATGGVSPSVPATAATGAGGAAAAEPEFLWAFSENVPVRAEPSKTAKAVRKLRYGEKVQAFETAGTGFVRIGEGQFVLRRHMTDRKARWGKDRVSH